MNICISGDALALPRGVARGLLRAVAEAAASGVGVHAALLGSKDSGRIIHLCAVAVATFPVDS